MADPLVLMGQICNFANQPSPDPDIAGHESEGPFVIGDARNIGRWSGLERKGRWKVKVLGPLAELPMIWGHVRPYLFHKDLPSAQQHFAAIKQNLATSMPGTSFQPHPTFGNGSVPGGRVEVIVGQDGGNAGVLMMDGVHDYDYATDMTPGVGAVPAGNEDGPRVVSWRPPASAPFVALGPGKDGLPDHVVLVFSPGKTDQRDFIAQGLPGMGRDEEVREVKIDLSSGVAIAMWARLDGEKLLAAARGGDPAAALVQYLGDKVAAPLDTGDPTVSPRMPGPVAWAIRVNPGQWRAQLWYADTSDGAGISACVMSRVGAGSFQLMQKGGAGGKIIAGLSLERYAELSAARDRLYMKAAGGAGGAIGGALMGAIGGQVGVGPQKELDALCDKFGVPRGTYGMAGRVTEWDQAIQASPDLSAEFAAYLAIANAKLDGVDPSTIDTAQIRANAMAVQEQVAKNAKAHANATELTLEGHYKVFEAARTLRADALIEFAKREAYAHLKPDDLGWAFNQANSHLHLYPDDACRVQGIRKVMPSFLEACWKAQPPADREGSLASFVKEQTYEIEEKYGIAAPSLLDRL